MAQILPLPSRTTISVLGRTLFLTSLSHCGPRVDSPRFLWVVSGDQVGIWSTTSWSNKSFCSPNHVREELLDLRSRGELNEVPSEVFEAIVDFASAQEAVYTDDLAEAASKAFGGAGDVAARAWIRAYFEEKVRPALDAAIRGVDEGAIPIGFKPEPASHRPPIRQARSYLFTRIVDRVFTVQILEEGLEAAGLSGFDFQTPEWERQEVVYQYSKRELRS